MKLFDLKIAFFHQNHTIFVHLVIFRLNLTRPNTEKLNFQKRENFWGFLDENFGNFWILTRAYLEIMQFGNIISSKTFSVKSRVILFSPFVIVPNFKNFWFLKKFRKFQKLEKIWEIFVKFKVWKNILNRFWIEM